VNRSEDIKGFQNWFISDCSSKICISERVLL